MKSKSIPPTPRSKRPKRRKVFHDQFGWLWGDVLFEGKFETVWVEVVGETTGWEWTITKYFRLKASTNIPGKLERFTPDREVDQAHLAKAAATVKDWFRNRDNSRKTIYTVS